jgi:hypothetical protein
VVSSAVRDYLDGRLFFHGTTEKSARKILREGTIVGAETQGRGWTDPIAGRVYLSPDVSVGAHYGGWKPSRSKVGVVFVVDGRDLVDVES